MNSGWLVPALTALGLLVNFIWTVINLTLTARLTKQISELKDDIAREYTSETLCAERMARISPHATA